MKKRNADKSVIGKDEGRVNGRKYGNIYLNMDKESRICLITCAYCIDNLFCYDHNRRQIFMNIALNIINVGLIFFTIFQYYRCHY